jgi:zinc protease
MKRAFLALFLVACAAEPLPAPVPAPVPASVPAPVASVPVRITPDAPFREHPPAGDPDVVFVAPQIQAFSLKNGVHVLLVERHELPIVSARVVIEAGAGDLPKEAPGLLSFLGSMLEQGTEKKSALDISDAFEAIGAAHGAWVDWDSGGASLKVMADKLDAGLALLGDVVVHPSFPQAEIDRLKARRVAALAQEKNSVGSMWFNAAGPAVYGRAHPYGNSLYGRTEDLAKVTRAELLKAHAALFVPSRAAIVVSGDVTKDALVGKLEATFGAWRGTAGAITVPKTPAPSKDDARVVWVDKPGAPQSVVRLVEVGVPRLAKDRDAITVMNTILGGMFSSRINLNLREAHAFTYGASSSFQMRHGAGSFLAGGNMVADKTAPAIAELFKEVRRMREGVVSDEELETAKQSIKRAMPGRFETVSEVTGALSDIAVYGLPIDEYATRTARIDKVTAEDVLAAAKAHLHPDALKVVVVGDRAKLEGSLETLHLGAIEERDAYGDPVGAGKGP